MRNWFVALLAMRCFCPCSVINRSLPSLVNSSFAFEVTGGSSRFAIHTTVLLSIPTNQWATKFVENDGVVSMVDGVHCWVCSWGADHFGRRSSWRIFLQNIFRLVVRYFWIDLVVWSFRIWWFCWVEKMMILKILISGFEYVFLLFLLKTHFNLN